jgi:hypothetical protein
MLQYGLKITQPGDPLRKLSIEQLHTMVTRPKTESADFIEQLRILAAVDERQYSALKKQLPYFVCGIFQPPIRRKENFAILRYFVLDLDHLSVIGLEQETLRERLRADARVLLYFRSPGGDGLKVMFSLAEDCRDANMFSAFYKVFARRFGDRYQLMGVIDPHTHDVTRACFLSVDTEAYFNPDAEPIRMSEYLQNLDFEDSEQAIRESSEVLRAQRPLPEVLRLEEVTPDILNRIRDRLNPSQRVPKQKTYYVPAALDEVMPMLKEALRELEIEVRDHQPIQYGRKVVVYAGKHFAEINVFFGKRGFSVVSTTKTGSNMELADLAAAAIRQVLDIG